MRHPKVRYFKTQFFSSKTYHLPSTYLPPPPVQFQPPNCRDRLKRTRFAPAVRMLMQSGCVFLGGVGSCLAVAGEWPGRAGIAGGTWPGIAACHPIRPPARPDRSGREPRLANGQNDQGEAFGDWRRLGTNSPHYLPGAPVAIHSDTVQKYLRFPLEFRTSEFIFPPSAGNTARRNTSKK